MCYTTERRILKTGVRKSVMRYRTDKYGEPISQLGFGCMRFTRKGGSIDYEKAEREMSTIKARSDRHRILPRPETLLKKDGSYSS